MTIATAGSGRLRGTRAGDILVFRGVPYAVPPVGNLRWRSPQSVEPWSGIRDATMFGPIAPQAISRERLAKRGQTMSEDCLSLNIWTPDIDDGRRPVVVFLHGGGVVAGSGSAALFDGERLAARGDLVVVTLNFRLGALGSLHAHEQVGFAEDPSTNLALRDQMAALAWIRAEIGAFGGDPRTITVMGQSSGAVGITCLLASPAGEGLFDRAILQSGGLERVRSEPAARAVAAAFFDELDPDGFGEPREWSVDEILGAQGRIPTGFVPPVGPFHHFVDRDIVAEHPLVAARERPLHRVPILAGTTRDEWRVFDAQIGDDEITDRFVRNRAASLAGTHADVDAILALHDAERTERDAGARRRAIASALVTDFHFAAPTEQLLAAHASSGNATFRYELDWESPRPGLGACHDVCLPLVFGTLGVAPALASDDAEAVAMSQAVQDAWIAFIRTGDPSCDALGAWPTYHPGRGDTMLIGRDAEVVSNHRRALLAIWDAAYPASG